MLDSSCIEARYAKSGELNIAYQECEVPGEKYSVAHGEEAAVARKKFAAKRKPRA